MTIILLKSILVLRIESDLTNYDKEYEELSQKENRELITLEKLGIDQMEAIVAFDKLCFPTDCWKESDWKELLEDERAIYYAFVEKERIVGDVFIYNWKGEDDYVKIMNLAIHAEYRKQGLAHRLLEHVTEEMKKEEMSRFCGETRASNRGMQKVFEDCGYKVNKVEENYFQNPKESAYKYVLQL